MSAEQIKCVANIMDTSSQLVANREQFRNNGREKGKQCRIITNYI